jgi:hypothetical protein
MSRILEKIAVSVVNEETVEVNLDNLVDFAGQPLFESDKLFE